MPYEAFEKILIANRGEIACRIARTAKAMGYRTVAVFSDADANSLHVKKADEAVWIGRSAPRDSYLRIDAILEAARQTGAGAVHPGYGFLAENAAIAEACEGAGLVFIGPPAQVIRTMGDKARAKDLMRAAGVPCVPGYSGSDQTNKRLMQEAKNLSFPLLIKAVAGGGGRGIRAVYAPAELPSQLDAARREAKSAFGDDRLMLEQFIEHPRHLEVQVFGDRKGNIVHLYERDCTTQRRRQKIIEEAPSPALTPEVRETLTGFAVRGARAAGYQNAGTVEFIADRNLNVYFLEMNTRLQVEHPVTEMVTGLDLVEWQLRVAAGESLPLRQDEISLRGHAIEARVCAEDPYDGFKPQTGKVLYFLPASRQGVRIDTGVEEGSEVSPFYDSMIAKTIAHGRDRREAVRMLASALDEAPLLGLPTNQQFLSRLLRSLAFRDATLSTDTLDGWREENVDLLDRSIPGAELWALAAAFYSERGSSGDWFFSSGGLYFTVDLECGGERKSLRCGRARDGVVSVAFDGTRVPVTLFNPNAPEIEYEVAGIRRRAIAVWDGTKLHLSADGTTLIFNEAGNDDTEDEASGGREIVAPVAGLVIKIFVEPGQMVEAGQPLALIEAMKMETRVTATHAGQVSAVHTATGAQVLNSALLFEIEKLDEPADV